MTFVSYAQNYEDVMLWRALGHIEKGYYIDVGAAWPDEDSVTKAFYDRGWSGINIEPNPNLQVLLQRERPRDTNLQVAVADEEGFLMMNFIGNTGLSTLEDLIAEQHSEQGLTVNRSEVRLTTLASICGTNVPLGQPIHFLKVDVEGLEPAVLKGNDWQRFRPWIVLVEATLPMSQTESHAEWEPTLTNAGYVFAYADGLNRFYVAEEHEELLQQLRYPPNIFDAFVTKGEKNTLTWAADLEQKLITTAAALDSAQASLDQAQGYAKNLEQQLHAIYASRSWRITAPLRWAAGQRSLLRQQGPATRLLALAKKTWRILGRLRKKLLGPSAADSETLFEDLSPNSKMIYSDLTHAIENERRKQR